MDTTLYQLLILFLLFYLFLIRPEAKKAKKHQEMLNSLKKGDKIITRSGVYGVISKVQNENDLLVDIAEGVTIVLNKMGVFSLADEAGAPLANNQTKKKNKGK